MTYRDPSTGRWAVKAPFQPVTVFVYGSLKKGYGLNAMLRECTFVGVGVSARRYKMIHVGYPVITPAEDGHPVRGEIYVVRDSYTMARLDSVESSYNRTPVKVNGCVDCHVYEGKEYWARLFRDEALVKPNADGELVWDGDHTNAWGRPVPDDEEEVVEPEDQGQGDVLGLDDERGEP